MKLGFLCLASMVFILSAFILLPQSAPAREAKAFIPDKVLCAQMIRFGKQSYQRGRFLDAKEYFRKAVQADPVSLFIFSANAEMIDKS